MRKTNVIEGQMTFFGVLESENLYIPPTPKVSAKTTVTKTTQATQSKPIITSITIENELTGEKRVFTPDTISKESVSTRRSDEDLQELFHLAIKMVRDIGIETEDIDPICKIFAKRANTWGYCRHRGSMNYISISEDLMHVSEHSLMTTLLHEVLHACKGCHNHGYLWKNYADKVNRTYGYNIKRTTSMEEKGIDAENRHIEYKYAVRCESCKRLVVRTKMCNIIKYPDNYRCGVCNGKFVREK